MELFAKSHPDEVAGVVLEATNGAQIVVQGSGHYVQIDHPAEVVRTILALLGATARGPAR